MKLMDKRNLKRSLEDMPPEKRISMVKDIFSTITPRYDLLNHVLSGWQDIRWRKFTARKLPQGCRKLLDVATGTGDLAMISSRMLKEASITGIDFSEAMLKAACEKRNCKRIHYLLGDAMELPFDDNTFDAAMAAFAFRNIPDRQRVLNEMKRTVRSGGKILVLEMTRPRGRISGAFFKYYLRFIVPAFGGLISGKREAYRYLSFSIEEFLSPDELMDYFAGAGLTGIKKHSLTFGITYLHEAYVP